jgi:hypothetical protein
MNDSGFKRARELADKDFHYDNLLEMARLWPEGTALYLAL